MLASSARRCVLSRGRRHGPCLFLPVLLLAVTLSTACPPGDTCSVSADCASGHVCVDKICRKQCQTLPDCPSGMVCELGVCLPAGTRDAAADDAVADTARDLGGADISRDHDAATDRSVVKRDGGADLLADHRGVDATTEEDGGSCPGKVCGTTCYPDGECCAATDCGAGGWICDVSHACLCPGEACGDGSCSSGLGESCCEAADCGTGSWSCTDNLCDCGGQDCGDGRCPPDEAGRCCDSTTCGAGAWSCEVTSCACALPLCADQFCPSESDCCTSGDCSDATWTCNDHRCECPGGVGCADGYCRPAGTGCCEVSDCGTGGAWSCTEHACVCGGLQCGESCVAGGTCCESADCLDGSHTGAWACNPSSHQCQCDGATCADGHCATGDECCTAVSCGDGAWQCNAHGCDCPGRDCSGSCRSGSDCCDVADCGSGNWSCDDGSCACSGVICGAACHAGGDCCDEGDCGSGDWICSGNNLCVCSGITCAGRCETATTCSTVELGMCKDGHPECDGGAIVCVRNHTPEPEQCDGLDHDCDGQPRNGVHLDGDGACVANGSFGELNEVEPSLPLLVAVDTAIHENFIFAYGGANTVGKKNTVYRNTLTAQGGFGPTWDLVSTLPYYREAEVFVYSDATSAYLFAMGGIESTSPSTFGGETDRISRARINADGTLGSWIDTTATLPYRARGFGHTLDGDNLYVTCGYAPDTGGITDELFFATIDPVDGDIDGFTDVAPPDTHPQFDPELIVIDQRLYMVGGQFDHRDEEVRSVPLGTGGVPVGGWQDHPAIEVGNAILGHALLFGSGYLFLVANHRYVSPSGADVKIGIVYSTPIAADGSPGTWQVVLTDDRLRRSPSIVERNGVLYGVGGYLPGSPWTYYDEVYRAVF